MSRKLKAYALLASRITSWNMLLFQDEIKSGKISVIDLEIVIYSYPFIIWMSWTKIKRARKLQRCDKTCMCQNIINNYWMRFLWFWNNQGRGKCYHPRPSARLITLTETLIILDIKKIESNDCFIIHCFEENNDNALRNLERLPFVRKFRWKTAKNFRQMVLICFWHWKQEQDWVVPFTKYR